MTLRPGITFPPNCTHAVVPPSLTMSSTLILVRVSRSHNKCILVPLDVLPSPLSSCLQKQEIVQNDHANRSSSCLPALALMTPSFPFPWPVCRCNLFRGEAGYRLRTALGLLPMQSFSGGKPDIDWQDGRLNLSLGEAEEESVDFGVLPYHSPPTTKGRMFGMRPRDPSPPGG